MIDGLWLRKAAGSAISQQEAIDLVIAHVSSFLTQKEMRPLRAPGAEPQEGRRAPL